MKILVIKPSSLGDVVHALPTVNLIRRQFPAAHISWLINANLASLLRCCPVINDRIEFHRHDAARWGALFARLRRERFDLVVDLQGLFRSGLMTGVTGARRRIGLSDAREGSRWFYNEIVPVPRAHAVDRYRRVARHLGAPEQPVEFPLGVPDAPRENWIAIHPSARWPTKLWGDDRFAALIRQLPRDRVIVTGTAADAARIETLAQGCRNLAGQTDLFELAALYRRCAVVVTNDSGPMHLAAAVGTPVVAIFGPTDPALTGPYGAGHAVLRAAVPCAPCLKPVCHHQPRMECMRLVSVAQVLATTIDRAAAGGYTARRDGN